MASSGEGTHEGVPLPDEDQGQGATSPQSLWLAATRDRRVAVRLVQAALQSREWVHRRVESVQFADDTTIRWRCSVDFSVPPVAANVAVNGSQFALIPLTWLEKSVLVNFDLRDESNTAIPVLTTRQNGEAAVSMLTGVGRLVLNDEVCDPVVCDLRGIVMGSPDDALKVFNALADPRGDPHEDRQRAALMTDPFFRILTRRFAETFLLVAALHAEVGERRILKYAFEANLEWKPPEKSAGSRVRPILQALGWQALNFFFTASAATDTETYHFEVEVPPGAELLGLALWGLPPGASPPGGWRRLDWRSGPKRRLHLRIARPSDGTEVLAKTTLRACRTGWLSASLLAAMVVTLVLGIGAWRVSTLFPANVRGGAPLVNGADVATALFIGITGAFAALLVRSEEHRLVGRLLRLLRFAMGLAAAVPFAAIGVLVFWPELSVVQSTWAILAGAAATIMVLLIVSWVLPRVPKVAPTLP
jgi:hypothetical protein